MFDKRIDIHLGADDVTVLDNEILKTASATIRDILGDHKFDPDFVYLLIRSVSAGEYWGANNNVDFFEEVELKPSHPTFFDGNVFKNHENKDVAKAIGEVLHTEYDDEMKAVMLVIRIDKELAPTIARGFIKGTITDVSMGCRVDHVVCSVCGNKAKTRRDYCEHLRDKKMRGSILADGTKVYEINKGPKFHDISVVTKGADRTAKAFQVLDGAKVIKEASLEKAASDDFGTRVKNMIPMYRPDKRYSAEELGFKVAADRAEILKVAEIDKIIKGNIVAIAGAKKYEEMLEKLPDVMDTLRLFHTEYFDDETTSKIADNITMIANKRKRDPEEVFRTFLRTAELSGIELTPLEFSAICKKITKERGPNPFALASSGMFNMKPNVRKVTIRLVREPSAPYKGRGLSLKNHVFSSVMPEPEIDLEREIFRNILSPFMEKRSILPRFFAPRLIRIASGDIPPRRASNMKHFALPLMSMTKIASDVFKTDMENYYSYQNERVAMMASGEIEKYSSSVTGEDALILKEAFIGSIAEGLSEKVDDIKDAKRMKKSDIIEPGTKANFGPPPKIKKNMGVGRTAMLAGSVYPFFHGYSKYQQAKINNNERVNSFDKMMADNPGAALGATAFGYYHAPKLRLAAKKLRNMTKFASFDEVIDPQLIKLSSAPEEKEAVMEKAASLGDLVEGSFFNNDTINKAMLKEYSPKQVDIMKIAMVHYFKGDESKFNELLNKQGLDESDVNSYLKVAQDFFTMKLEKLAEDMIDPSKKKKKIWTKEDSKEVGKDIIADSMFHTKLTGSGFGSMMPGTLVDGFVLNRIYKAFEGKNNKGPNVEPTTKGGTDNGKLV